LKNTKIKIKYFPIFKNILPLTLKYLEKEGNYGGQESAVVAKNTHFIWIYHLPWLWSFF
jgi:hypothetical protein